METGSLFTIIGTALFLIIAIVMIVYRLKSKSIDNDMAKEFLEGLTDNIHDEIIAILNNFNTNISKFNTIEEFEVNILMQIYDSTWKYVEAEVSRYSKDDVLFAILSNVIDKEYVEKFVSNLIDDIGLSARLESMWIDKIELISNQEAESLDNELQNEFANEELYFEESFLEELPLAQEEEISPEELEKLNPQVDEEESFNPEDSSMEVVEEEDEFYYDDNGRKRNRATGRFA